jgi:gliding motility-associated-like protein
MSETFAKWSIYRMNKFFLITSFSFLFSIGVHAQYPSNQGRFQVDQKSGCAPFTINLTIVPPDVCNGANPCDMDYGDTFAGNLVFTHTYTIPGTYWLQVLIQASGIDSVLIEVLPDIPPSFEIYTCGGNQIAYAITDSNYDQYVVDFNDGSPVDIVPALASGMHNYASSGSQTITVRGRNLSAQDNCTAVSQSFTAVASLTAPFINTLTVLNQDQIQLDFLNNPYIQYRLEIATNGGPLQFLQNVYNTATVTVGNLTPDTNYYCFRLGAFDPCNNTTAYSNVICSSDFDLGVQNNLNALSWSTSAAGINDYSLERDYSNYLNIPGNLNGINDIDVVCKTTYNYQLVSNYVNGSRSYSLIKSGTAISNTPPTPVENITAIVNQNSVDLSWSQDPNFTPLEYVISKSTGGGEYTAIGKAPAPAFTDDLYSGQNPVCYRIAYTDLCDNKSEAIIDACPVQLNGELQGDNSVVLTWTPYSGWQNDVQGYLVEKYDDKGFLLQTFNVGKTTTFTDNTSDPAHQIYVYVVKADPNDPGLGQAVSNRINIIKDPNLFYPTAFTPNGDGLNDDFIVFGQYVNGFKMNIFNRWGELIYSTDDINQRWDGTLNGKVMPEGTYVFRADLIDFAGRTFNQSGAVLLLRKK